MSLNASVEDERAEFTVMGVRGQRVTFDVRFRSIKVGRVMGHQPRYVVGLKGSDGDGFAHYTSFDKACSAALSRARRYERAVAR